MPYYTYRCKNCNKEYDMEFSMEFAKHVDKVDCPVCGEPMRLTIKPVSLSGRRTTEGKGRSV